MKSFGRSILGLDIGSHSIKLVEVKHARGGPLITCAKAIAIAHEGEVTYSDISRALRKLLNTSKVRSQYVITALSSAEEQVIMRTIFMPEMTAEVSYDAVRAGARFQAEEQSYIPYDIDYAVMNFDIMGEATVDGVEGLEVFFVSAHRDLIGSRTQLLREVGLTPIAIDIDILAIARLLGFTEQIQEDNDIAIIDIGASKACVCFYQHGKPYIYPHIPTAGDNLTSELANQLQISWKKAEEEKKLQGSFKNFPKSESIKFSFKTEVGASLNSNTNGADSTGVRENTVDEVFDILQRALEKNEGLCPLLQSRFEYYEADFPKPAKIITSGGTSQLASLDEFLASRLSIPVERSSYLEKIPVDAKGDVSEIKENEPLFTTAVGLALKKL